jgi:hypothetical protein
MQKLHPRIWVRDVLVINCPNRDFFFSTDGTHDFVCLELGHRIICTNMVYSQRAILCDKFVASL